MLVLTLILIGIMLMATNILVSTHTASRRNILAVIAIIVIVVAIAILVGHGLGLIVYILLIAIGFGFIALDAFAAGLIRD